MDSLGYFKHLVILHTRKSCIFGQFLLFNIHSNFNTAVKDSDPNQVEVNFLIEEILKCFNNEQYEFFKVQTNFIESLTNISRDLLKYDKNRREAGLKLIKNVKIPERVFLPTDPNCLIHSINLKSIRPMKSAAKSPYLIEFYLKNVGYETVEKYCTDKSFNLNLDDFPTESKRFIIKYGDDLRQDMLAIQFMKLLMKIYSYFNFDLYTYPYSIVATGYECGIIECIPNSSSIDDLLSQSLSLVAHLISSHGDIKSLEMEQVRLNFINSHACGIIINYFLQLKDRHNGNIMVDTQGNYYHIDFGYVLGMTPGFSVENQIKYDPQTRNVFNDINSDTYGDEYQVYFEMAVVKGIYGLKYYMPHIKRLVAAMDGCPLPCFPNNNAEIPANKLIKLYFYQF
ncbi:MAG: Phosphatidylinositol 4-kinase alpha [Paramarteilia canceri]